MLVGHLWGASSTVGHLWGASIFTLTAKIAVCDGVAGAPRPFLGWHGAAQVLVRPIDVDLHSLVKQTVFSSNGASRHLKVPINPSIYRGYV